jgi:hypothetical protein
MNKDKNENTGGELPVYDPAGLPDSDANQPEEFTYPLVQSDRPWLQTNAIDVDAMAEFEAMQAAEQALIIQSPGLAPLHNLTISGIATMNKHEIVWREGHLEHLARAYAADPALTRRDYLDDLIVAENLDAEKFAALVDKARGE